MRANHDPRLAESPVPLDELPLMNAALGEGLIVTGRSPGPFMLYSLCGSLAYGSGPYVNAAEVWSALDRLDVLSFISYMTQEMGL
jgi:hypothetical protein